MKTLMKDAASGMSERQILWLAILGVGACWLCLGIFELRGGDVDSLHPFNARARAVSTF